MKENFSENLRKFRKIRKLSQTQLAEMTGNELRTIQHYEAGERDFGLGKIETIANVLDISVADLLGIPGARPSPQEAWKIVGKALGVEIHPTVPVGMIEAMKDPRIRSMIEDVLDDTMPEWREVRHATR